MLERNVLTRTADHPLFIRLMYTFQDPEHLYFVLDCAEGGDLLGAMRASGDRLSLPIAAFYIAATALALEHLHTHLHVVHRDVKPENILLDSRGVLKMADFGSAKDEDATVPDAGDDFVGTAEYVSPEVLRDEAAHAPADLWSLGALCYQILCGRPPFRGASEYLTFQQILGFDHAATVEASNAADITRAASKRGEPPQLSDAFLALGIDALSAVGSGVLILARARAASIAASSPLHSPSVGSDIIDMEDDARDFYEIEAEAAASGAESGVGSGGRESVGSGGARVMFADVVGRGAPQSVSTTAAEADAPLDGADTATQQAPRSRVSFLLPSEPSRRSADETATRRLSRAGSISAARAAGPPRCILRFPANFPVVARNFVLSLLHPNPQLRLGVHSTNDVKSSPGEACGSVRLDYAALRTHDFFAGIDWAAVADPNGPGRPAPPFTPPTRVFPLPRAVTRAAAVNGLIGDAEGDEAFQRGGDMLAVVLEGEVETDAAGSSSRPPLLTPPSSLGSARSVAQPTFLSSIFSPLFSAPPTVPDSAADSSAPPLPAAADDGDAPSITDYNADSPLPKVRLMLAPSREGSAASTNTSEIAALHAALPAFVSTAAKHFSGADGSVQPPRQNLLSFVREGHVPRPAADDVESLVPYTHVPVAAAGQSTAPSSAPVATAAALPPSLPPPVRPTAAPSAPLGPMLPWAYLLDGARGEYAVRWGPCEKRKTYGLSLDTRRELLLTFGGPSGPRLLYLQPSRAESSASSDDTRKSTGANAVRYEIELADPDLDVVLRQPAHSVADAPPDAPFSFSRWFGFGAVPVPVPTAVSSSSVTSAVPPPPASVITSALPGILPVERTSPTAGMARERSRIGFSPPRSASFDSPDAPLSSPLRTEGSSVYRRTDSGAASNEVALMTAASTLSQVPFLTEPKLVDSAAETGRRHSAPDISLALVAARGASTHVSPESSFAAEPSGFSGTRQPFAAPAEATGGAPSLAAFPHQLSSPPRKSTPSTSVASAESSAAVSVAPSVLSTPARTAAGWGRGTGAGAAASRDRGIFDIHTGAKSPSSGRVFYLFDPLGAADEWAEAILLAKKAALALKEVAAQEVVTTKD